MPRYYMLNKPRGYISACRDAVSKTVLDIFPEQMRKGLFHIGRLDKDTEGLLLLSNDGPLCYRLLSPDNEIPKVYICYVNGKVDKELLSKVEAGVNIYKNSDKLTHPAKIELLSETTLGEIKAYLSGKDIAFSNRRPSFPVTLVRVTITEGKKHQVKRMMAYMKNRVLYLKRLSFAGIKLDESLQLGEYRALTDDEVNFLKTNNNCTCPLDFEKANGKTN